MTTNQPAVGRRHYAFVAAAIIIAAAIVSGTIALVSPTLRTTVTTTETTTATTTSTVTPTSFVNGTTPFIFLTASAICTAPGGYAPCWGSPAYVFQCTATQNLLSGPATTQQCTQKVTSTMAPHPSYIITISIPVTRQSGEPTWANCQWSMAGITPGSGYGYCIALGSASNYVSFIMGEPAPPHPGTTITTSTNTNASAPTSYSVNATFVMRFCSNSSSIPRTGNETTNLQPSGSAGPIGFSIVGAEWKNAGSSPIQVMAVCVDAVGVVPSNAANQGLISGATASTLQLDVSPSNPIQPGQQANITARFAGGSGMYYMPQGGLTFTIVASDGSTASWSGPEGGGYVTTGKAPAPVVSISHAFILGGSAPTLSLTLAFNSSNSQISEVDLSINGTYIGSVGVGHDTTSPGAPSQYTVAYVLGIKEPGRIAIISGNTYLVTIVAATRGFQETSVSTTLVAG